MKFNDTFKAMGAIALSLSITVGVCGCGDGGSSGATFSPAVRSDAALVYGANFDKSDELLDYYIAQMEKFGVDEDTLTSYKAMVEEYKADPFKDAPKEVRDFITDSGLGAAKFHWGVLSLSDFAMTPAGPKLNGFSLALFGDFDLEKFLTTVGAMPEMTVAFEKADVEGEPAWRVVPKDDDLAKVLDQARVKLNLASLDGRLTLIASSEDALKKQIRLYRKGEGKGDALAGFSATNGEVFQICLSGIGDLVRDNIPSQSLAELNNFVLNADKIACGLKRLSISSTLQGDGTMANYIGLEAGSAEDAETLRALARSGIATGAAKLAKDKNVPREIANTVAAIAIAGEGSMVEVRGVDPIALVTGAMLPAIVSAQRSAQTSALSMKGRNLFVAITQANTDRECAGLDDIWPRTVAVPGADADDIAGVGFKNAAEYFGALFDIRNIGSKDYMPYVDIDLNCLGANAVVGKTINAAGLDWCVAANITYDMPDSMPVLISANFNPALLLSSWDGYTDARKSLPIGPASGAAKSMFGDSAIVVIRKGGSAEVIKKKYLNYAVLYRRQAFSLSESNPPLVYLTPNGAVEVK